MSTEEKNEEQNKTEEIREELPKRARSRTRQVDYMRVEDTMHGQSLSPFELQVKEKIACVSSPYQEIARKEEEEEKSRELQRKVKELIEKARLTSVQEACYHLVYVEMLSDSEIAERLSLAERNVRRLKRSVFKALKRVSEKERIKKLADACELTDRQRLAVQLRYQDQLSLKEIGGRLQIKVRAVDRLLRRVREKIFSKKKNSDV